ncbi:MAG: carboxypeptidase-like regulatory domain-containing protein, partial [Candidatus Kapabacteria bacterium]|nr:carboxypeptidase-like regulatory domain-containing protein [Candidatus Kapabacteria bacterium]
MNSTLETTSAKLIAVALFFFSITAAMPAQTSSDTLTQTVRGTIVDAVTSAPLPGITIRMVGPDSAVRGAYSDTRGRFRVQRLPVGRYVVS